MQCAVVGVQFVVLMKMLFTCRLATDSNGLSQSSCHMGFLEGPGAVVCCTTKYKTLLCMGPESEHRQASLMQLQGNKKGPQDSRRTTEQ